MYAVAYAQVVRSEQLAYAAFVLDGSRLSPTYIANTSSMPSRYPFKGLLGLGGWSTNKADIRH
jgi:hypothetical protein